MREYSPNSSTFRLGSDWSIVSIASNYQVSSSINPSYLLGNPTIHLVIDLLSQIIVGCYVGLKRDGKQEKLLALENALMNNAEFRRLEIETSSIGYPYHHGCDSLSIDSASGAIIDALFRLEIRVKAPNPKQMAQMSAVEREINHHIVSLISTLDTRDRRLDTTLDFKQFQQLIAQCILHYNNHIKPEFCVLNKQVEHDVKLSSIEAWNWGIQNGSTHSHAVSHNSIRLNLLPQAKASITPNGIIFKGLQYRGETTSHEHWLTRSRANRDNKVIVVYDPRNVDVLYLLSDDNIQSEVWYLTDRYKHFRGRSSDEVKKHFDMLKAERKSLHDAFEVSLKKIISEAVEQKREKKDI